MSDEFLPYGSSRYAGLVTKQGCQSKFVAPRVAPDGAMQQAEGTHRLVRRNARKG